MSDAFKDMLASGRKLLSDTKNPKKPLEPVKKTGKVLPAAGGSGPMETDPHKLLTRRAVKEKPKKAELTEEFQKFCDMEDEKL